MADTKQFKLICGPQPSEAQLAYIAGFFDGEGSIGIYEKRYVVSLTNTDIRPLRLAQEWWGGRIYTQTHESREFAIRDLFRWQLYGHGSREFLEEIRPFAVIKAEQIDVYLEALTRVPKLGGKYRLGDREAIETAAAQLKHLKVVGA